MGDFIVGFSPETFQPCFKCHKEFKTTYEAQAMNSWIHNPYGQFCEPCARTRLLDQHPGTEHQLDEAIPQVAEQLRNQYEGREM